MYENIRLQTSRLLLRPVSPDDLSTVYAYSSDGEHVKYMKYYPDESMEVCKRFLIQTCQEWSKEFPRCYVFAVIQNNRHIGEVSVSLKMKLLQSENLDGSFTEITAIKDMPQKLRRRFSVFAKTHSILIKSLPAVTAETLHP